MSGIVVKISEEPGELGFAILNANKSDGARPQPYSRQQLADELGQLLALANSRSASVVGIIPFQVAEQATHGMYSGGVGPAEDVVVILFQTGAETGTE